MSLSTDQIRAVTFDAYGTLLRLDRPFERLAEELARIGLQVPLDIVTNVFLKEMAYYREHHLQGNDPENLLGLRLRCADVLFSLLEREGYTAEVSREERLTVLMGSIRFAPYEDALPALDWCMSRGLTLGVVSVWDCSLVATLKDVVPYPFSRVFVSAVEGMGKSDGRLFLRAAEGLGVLPPQIIHIGDEVDSDILGAEKAGMKAVLIDRDHAHRDSRSPRIKSLEEFPHLFEQRFSVIQSPHSG